MTRWVSCCPASPLDKKASQTVNRCHNATFVFSSVGKRIAWVYFNHSWPGAGNINSEFAILAGAYYPRSYPLTLTLSLREREPPGNRYSPGIHRGANAHAHDERKITPPTHSGGRGNRPAIVAAPVKRQRRIKNTHRFVKFFLVIDKNFFFFAADGQFVGA